MNQYEIYNSSSESFSVVFAKLFTFLDEDEKQKIVFTPKIDMNETYTMVESEAYFEAYKHVLKGLQGKMDSIMSIKCDSEDRVMNLKVFFKIKCSNFFNPTRKTNTDQ